MFDTLDRLSPATLLYNWSTREDIIYSSYETQSSLLCGCLFDGTRFPTPAQCLSIRFVREDKVLRPHFPYRLIHPSPLLFIPQTVRPPSIHAAPNRLGVDLAVFALLSEHKKQKSSVQPLEAKFRQALQNPRNTEIVVRCTCASPRLVEVADLMTRKNLRVRLRYRSCQLSARRISPVSGETSCMP